MMACVPFFVIALTVLIISVSTGEAKAAKAYARAGDVASEVSCFKLLLYETLSYECMRLYATGV